MGLYGDKKDYEEMVKENIAKANILHSISPEKHDEVIKLLNQKEKRLSVQMILQYGMLLRL